jgi:hypothetical protein
VGFVRFVRPLRLPSPRSTPWLDAGGGGVGACGRGAFTCDRRTRGRLTLVLIRPLTRGLRDLVPDTTDDISPNMYRT